VSEFQPVLNSVLGAGIVGLVAWLWALWKSHTDLRLKLAEEYPKTPSMQSAVAAAILPLEKAIAAQATAQAHQGRILEAIARQMHIPTAVLDD